MRNNNLTASQKRARRSLRLTILESGLTAGNMSMPIMELFFVSIGMTHAQISISQAFFTIVVLCLNIPLGYFADRFSRKWANIIGDLLHGVALLYYSHIGSIYGAIIAEAIFGIGAALSQGVDSTLLQHFSEQYQHDSFRKYYAYLSRAREIGTLAILTAGIFVNSISYQVSITASAVPFFLAAIVSLFIHDDSEKLSSKKVKQKNESNEEEPPGMFEIIKMALSIDELRLRIGTYVIMRESTHAAVWVFSGLLHAVGLPESLITIGWIINAIAAIIGNALASKYQTKLKDCALFAIPMIAIATACCVIGSTVNTITVCFYFTFGIVKGWTGVVAMPPVKECIEKHFGNSVQTTIESLVKVIAQLVYVPVIYLMGYVADIDIRYSMIATFFIFIPAAVVMGGKLRRFCRK